MVDFPKTGHIMIIIIIMMCWRGNDPVYSVPTVHRSKQIKVWQKLELDECLLLNPYLCGLAN